MKNIEYIRENVPERELLEQLAEESAEMTKAALKLIRAKGLSNNPTPKEAEQLKRELMEEFADVSIIIFVLFSFMITPPFIYGNNKIKRWVKRLREAKAARAKEGGEENGIK